MQDIKDTTFYKMLKQRKETDELIILINKAYKKCYDILPLINKIFHNYTIHGIKHSLNVMEYMADLINDLNKLSDLDILLCVYAALFHDIGMVVNDTDIENIKNGKDELINYDFNVLMDKFHDETLVLQECIRPVHGKRVKKILESNDFEDLFMIPNTNISFRKELINICQAHNEDFDWIELNIENEIKKGPYEANPQFIALLLRLGDLLDIDAERAPQYLFHMINPKGVSEKEWKQHFILENFKKVQLNEKLQCKELQFYGSCDDPEIHRKFLRYIDYIKEELIKAVRFSEKFENKIYVLNLLVEPKIIIQTQGFNFADFKLNLDYNAVTNLLMGENIYGNKKYGLREIIQNSIDACMVQSQYYIKNPNPYDKYSPLITIEINSDKKRVSIYDNGTGMTLEVLKKYFLNVGVSYYKSNDFQYNGYKYIPIGNYGIGFLACFMLSNNVKVITKSQFESKAIAIQISKDSEYVCVSSESIQFNHGTEIIFNYDDFMCVFENVENVKKFIQENFIADGINISINYFNNGKVNEIPVDLVPLKNTSTFNVSLTEYLNDIEAYANVKFSKSCFINDLADVTKKETFFYDVNNHNIISEKACNTFNIKKYVEEGKIKYLDVAIIDDYDADEYNKAVEILDDYEDALDKVLPNYISIVYTSDQEVDYGVINEGNIIIESYGFDDLVYGFDQSFNTNAFVDQKEQLVVFNESDTLLAYSKNEQIRNDGHFWPPTDKLYCKNVLITNAYLTIPYVLNDLKIDKLVINSKHKDLIPNVTRNDYSKLLKEKLSYAIGKSIHLWILDNFNLSNEERGLIKNYIKEFYSKENEFLKNGN